MKSGFFGIGLYHPRHQVNIGGLFRHAQLYGASFLFTIGQRYRHQHSDTGKAPLSVPMYNYLTFDDFYDDLPYGCQLICVEQYRLATPLTATTHPPRAAYLLGSETNGIPEKVLENHRVVEVPCPINRPMNVTHAGTIVMYDRYVKGAESRGQLP